MRLAHPVVLNPEQKEALEQCARARSRSVRMVERARIVLLAATGKQDKEVACRIEYHRAQSRALAQPVSGSGPGGAGERRSASGAHPQYPGLYGEAGNSQNHAGEAGSCHALVHAHHGSGDEP